MDTMAAVDAFFIVDGADAVVGIGDGAHRAGLLAGSFHMHNSTVRTGFRAHSAGFALCRIDMHPGIARADGTEVAGIETGLAQAEPADVRDQVILNRTVVAGCWNHRHHLTGLTVHIRIQSHGQADPSADDFPFLVDTATVLGFGSGNDLQHQLLAVLVRQFSVPRQAAHLAEDMVFQFNNAFVVGNLGQPGSFPGFFTGGTAG